MTEQVHLVEVIERVVEQEKESSSYYEGIAEQALQERRRRIEYGEEVVHLPHWDEDQRAAPAAVVRSALFGVVKRGTRAAVQNELLASWAGNEIRYTGFRLDQADFDCWLQVLHLARAHPLGRGVRFTGRGFLSAIGRKGDGNSQRWLQRSLGRMQSCGVRIKLSSGQFYQGPLIADFFADERTGRYVVRVNPLIADLFDEAFVKISVEKRRLLTGKDLASWLQCYLQSHRATHEHPHRVSSERLQELSGSLSPPRKFKQLIKKAVNELLENDLLLDFKITKNGAFEFVRK